MLPPPDFDALAARLEYGRAASPPLLLLGRACGRVAGTPTLEDLASQSLALLDPDREAAPSAMPVDQSRIKELKRAFLSAFPTAQALDQMLAYSTGLKLSPTSISDDATLADRVERLFHFAAADGQLDALVTAAAAYNPGNLALRDVQWRSTSLNAEASHALLAEFRERFRELSALERYSLLQTIYRRIPVPVFYQELSRLVKAGYVRHIITTNIDSLFEQALESVGLVRDVDFDVIPLGTETSRDALTDLDVNRPLVLKLHGDISQGEFGVTPDEIDYAVHTAKRFIKDELQRAAIVVVGYEDESGPLNDWLARAMGEVWWVHADPPPNLISTANASWVPLGPADLFAALAARLLTLRAGSPPPGGRAADMAAPGLESIPATRGARAESPPANERELLRLEIERLKSETVALGQLGSAGSQLQRQEEIAQRRRRIGELEDQLRALPGARDEILQLLDRVRQSIVEAEHQTDQNGRVDSVTAEYFSGQVNTLREQYTSAQPNAHVVSATLGAALVLAERLGPSVVDPQDLQALAAFGPTLTARS